MNFLDWMEFLNFGYLAGDFIFKAAQTVTKWFLQGGENMFWAWIVAGLYLRMVYAWAEVAQELAR